MTKNSSEGKRVHYFYTLITALLKTLLGKPNEKNHSQGKKSAIFLFLKGNISSPLMNTSLEFSESWHSNVVH